MVATKRWLVVRSHSDRSVDRRTETCKEEQEGNDGLHFNHTSDGSEYINSATRQVGVGEVARAD